MFAMPSKNVTLLITFILCSFSLLRLFRISIKTTSFQLHLPVQTFTPSRSSSTASNLTEKELNFLINLISNRAPCNLLIFGLESKAAHLSAVNAGGRTAFMVDDLTKVDTLDLANNTSWIHRVEHDEQVVEAYDLIRHARANPACSPSRGLRDLKCKLEMTALPSEINNRRWDVVVIDSPSGDHPEAFGRMKVIYTMGRMTRKHKEATDIVVHDVDRTVEMWYSWEFLCEENLISAKGKFWHFRIQRSQQESLCSNKVRNPW